MNLSLPKAKPVSRRFLLIAWLLFCATSVGIPGVVNAMDVEVRLKDGTSIKARLVSFDSESLVLQKADSSSQTIQLESVATVINSKPDEDTVGSHRIRLVDGSELSMDSFISVGTQLSIRYLGQSFDFSRRNVEWVLFDANTQVDRIAQRWQEVIQKELKDGDRLVVIRNDNLDWLDGVIGDSTEEKTGFKLGDRNASVSRSKIAGLIFYHASGRELTDPVCQLQGIDGSRMNIRNAKVDGENLELTFVSGDQIRMPSKLVSKFDFASSRYLILSELKPAAIRWDPILASESTVEILKKLNQPRFNQSFREEPLSLTVQHTSENGLQSTVNQVFENGWAARSGTRIVYSIGGQYSQLNGKVGFAPTVGRSGNLKLRIRGDGKILFEQELKSDTEKIVELDVKIESVDRLIFEVDYLDGRSVDDELHFCDMKVVK